MAKCRIYVMLLPKRRLLIFKASFMNQASPQRPALGLNDK